MDKTRVELVLLECKTSVFPLSLLAHTSVVYADASCASTTCTPGWTRTSELFFVRKAIYPTNLQRYIRDVGPDPRTDFHCPASPTVGVPGG